MQKGQIKLKNRIRPNMALEKSHFGLRVGAIWWEKEKEKKKKREEEGKRKKRRRRRKKEEEKRRIQVWNFGLELLLCLEIDIGWFGTCLEILFGTFGWNSCLG